MVPLRPNRFIVRSYASFWILIYGMVYFVFPDIIPEKYLRDAVFIQNLIEGNSSVEGDSSFATTSAIFGLLPQEVVHIVVALLNSYILWCILKRIQTFRGMALIMPGLIPLALLDMMAPVKDTIVITMSLLIYSVSLRSRTSLPLLVTIIGVYAVYGTFLRTYYLLIMMVFVGFLLVDKLKSGLRFFCVPLVLLVIFILPEQIYESLEGSRDEVYFSLSGGSQHIVRTMFANPFVPDSGLHFLANYIYAFCLLNFPFVMDLTSNEVVLFVNVIINTWLLFAGIRSVQGPQRLLAFLFLAHITVLIFFEPDFGSYMRHFSSVLLYLIPAFCWREQKHIENLRLSTLARRIGV